MQWRQAIVFSLLARQALAGAPKGDTELPAVTSMMNASAHTLGRISVHVAKIGSHMNELIAQQKTELATQKVDFEKKLKKQSNTNAKLEAQNEQTSTEIWNLEKSNDDLRDQAKKLQKQNKDLRKAVATVEDKVGAVDVFAKKVLNSTDDEGNADLAVLDQQGDKNAKQEDAEQSGEEDKDKDAKEEDKEEDTKEDTTAPATDSDVKQDDKAEEESAVSEKDGDSQEDAAPAANATDTEETDEKDNAFLAISSKTTRTRRARRDDADTDDDDDGSDDKKESDAAPAEEPAESEPEDGTQATEASENATVSEPADSQSNEMVSELTKEITQLSQQQDKSRAKLAELFQARFKKGAAQKSQILGKQKLLTSTKASLTKLHTELQGAVKHLQGTKTKLENQLHGLGHYLAKLASYVNKPAADAEKALPSLPSDVQTFLQSKS